MKKRVFKGIISLVLIVVMTVSTMVVSAVSISAANEVKYEFRISTGGGDATSIDIMEFTVIGTKKETSAHKMPAVASKEGVVYASFEDKVDVGEIVGIRIKNIGIDGWYPNYIIIKSPSDEEIVYGYRWIDNNNEVTLSKDDNVYSLDIATAGSQGTSSGNISVKLNGDKGSTSWYNVGKIAKNRTGSASFYDANNIGSVKSVTVKNDGSDDWYPETVTISKLCRVSDTKIIKCGKWVNDKKEVTFSLTDRVAKVTVKTADLDYAGTDADVYVQLVDEKGNTTGETNLSSIHPKSNAFERGDIASFYISIPENFGTVSKVNVRKGVDVLGWYLDNVDVTLDGETIKFGAYMNIKDTKTHSLFPSEYSYTVTVKTSDKPNSGTNNDVYLIAYDENNNEIQTFELDSSDNNFEQGGTDVFYIATSRKIANIEMYLKYDLSTDWHLDYVQLDMYSANDIVESVKYVYCRWIDIYDGKVKPTSKEELIVG